MRWYYTLTAACIIVETRQTPNIVCEPSMIQRVYMMSSYKHWVEIENIPELINTLHIVAITFIIHQSSPWTKSWHRNGSL